MLVAPTEPTQLRALGLVSSVPEKFGSDFLIVSKSFGLVGVQRKEINDLIASVHDGRLQRELSQIKFVGQGVLLIEGNVQWSLDGSLMSGSNWTIAQHQGLIWSVQSRGLWIANVLSLGETISWLSLFTRWLGKERHSSLSHRPKNVAKGSWGNSDNRDWGIHLLQSFEGIGPEVAARIYDHFKGVPLTWEVSTHDLMQVPGVGKSRAESLVRALTSLNQVSQPNQSATQPTTTSTAQSPQSLSSSRTESENGYIAGSEQWGVDEGFIELSEIANMTK